MTTGWDKADIVSKVIIGVAGLALSVVVACEGSKYRESLKESEKAERQKRDRDTQASSLKEEFRAFYSFVREAPLDSPSAKGDADLASAAAATLAAQYKLPIYQAAINELERQRLAQKQRSSTPLPAAALASARNALQLQTEESSTIGSGTGQRALARSDPGRWFAVVGSYSITNGRGEAIAKAAQLSAAGLCPMIWQTKISRNYAVTVGNASSRELALARAADARSNGIAFDAFTQIDREWARIDGECAT